MINVNFMTDINKTSQKNQRFCSLVLTGNEFRVTKSNRTRIRLEVKCDCGYIFDIAKGNWGRQKKCKDCNKKDRAYLEPLKKGVRFGKLTATSKTKVIWKEHLKVPRNLKYHQVICDCGIEFYIQDKFWGRAQSCKDCSYDGKNVTHGMSNTIEYRLYLAAKARAKKYNHKFEIDVVDIIIPKFCPVLGIKLSKELFKDEKYKAKDNSASIDRINSQHGYTKNNIAVISWRANSIKNEGSAEEHEAIAEFMEAYEK